MPVIAGDRRGPLADTGEGEPRLERRPARPVWGGYPPGTQVRQELHQRPTARVGTRPPQSAGAK